MQLRTPVEFENALLAVFPFSGDDGGFVLSLAQGSSAVAADERGLVVTLQAIGFAESKEEIEDIREQTALLVRSANLPLDSTRLASYLSAVERVFGEASRAEFNQRDPAAWFDCDLLDGPAPREEQLVEMLQPELMAKREMMRWLSSGFEFGKPPSSIALWDRRSLYWPPTNNMRDLFLFRYEYVGSSAEEKPLRGVGLVGSTTFSMFGEEHQTPEEALAAHCLMELKGQEDPRANGGTLEDMRRLLGFHSKLAPSSS